MVEQQLAEALRHGAGAPAIGDILDPLPLDEWMPLVEHALREQPREMEAFLRWAALHSGDDIGRFNAIMVLRDNRLIDDEVERELLRIWADQERPS